MIIDWEGDILGRFGWPGVDGVVGEDDVGDEVETRVAKYVTCWDVSSSGGVLSFFMMTARLTVEMILLVTVGGGVIGSASGIPTGWAARPKNRSSKGESGWGWTRSSAECGLGRDVW